MPKIIVVDPERCNGCRLCEIVCSVKKEGVSDPSQSRIRIIDWETEGVYLPLICQHCEEPVCESVCPVIAIERDEVSGQVEADEEACVSCRSCVSTCPLGGLGFDINTQKVLRCDLCNGDPVCVMCCETGAIQFVESDQMQKRKKHHLAKKLWGAGKAK